VGQENFDCGYGKEKKQPKKWPSPTPKPKTRKNKISHARATSYLEGTLLIQAKILNPRDFKNGWIIVCQRKASKIYPRIRREYQNYDSVTRGSSISLCPKICRRRKDLLCDEQVSRQNDIQSVVEVGNTIICGNVTEARKEVSFLRN